MERHLFKKITEHLPEGVVIMDENRQIYFINKKAHNMTGWKVNEYVPYCTYRQLREVPENEERCILAMDNPLPSFRSHIPNYVNNNEDFEMTMTKIPLENKVFQILIIREPSWSKGKEQVKVKQLLIQEAMLAQEAERKRIARELHDQIGQSVYSIFLGLEGIKPHIQNEDSKKHLVSMINIMERTLKNIKQLTKELRPQLIDILGLETALKSHVKEWEALYNIKFTLDLHLSRSIEFNKDQGLHLFRLIQEAVHNAVRHGKAQHIHIELRTQEDKIYFQITDDGIGFDIEQARVHGLGIHHMKERIHMLHGDVKWITQPGGPTRVEGFVPIE